MHLQYNDFGCEGASALAVALLKNSSLEELEVRVRIHLPGLHSTDASAVVLWHRGRRALRPGGGTAAQQQPHETRPISRNPR